MAKTKQSDLIASIKMLNIGVINKDTINLGMGGGGYSVLVNYQSFLSSFFSLAQPAPSLRISGYTPDSNRLDTTIVPVA